MIPSRKRSWRQVSAWLATDFSRAAASREAQDRRSEESDWKEWVADLPLDKLLFNESVSVDEGPDR